MLNDTPQQPLTHARLIGLRGKPRTFRTGKDSAGRAAALYSELYI